MTGARGKVGSAAVVAHALSKHFGEQLCDAAVRRSDLRCISLRPSWVPHEGNYERNIGPLVRDPSLPGASFWSYVDVDDLADAIRLAVESELRRSVPGAITSTSAAGAVHDRRGLGRLDGYCRRCEERADGQPLTRVRAAV